MVTLADTSLTTAAGVVAAVAALVTVFFAWRTVTEARKARTEAHEAHGDEMSEMRSATEAAAVQHQAEMAERERAYEADLVLRRITQLEQVSQLVLHLAEVGREEYFSPPAPLHLDGGQIVTTTRVPAIQARLRTAVNVLHALGGPDLMQRLPASSSGDKSSSQRVWHEAIDLLIVIEFLPDSGDPAFTLPAKSE